MSDVKITAPVGLSPRESDGKPVKNKPADVLVIRQMLEANKIGPLGTSPKVDTGLLKAIEKYQKKIGIKKPDQVIDPGQRTFLALKPKYVKALKDAAKEPRVQVTFRGKQIECTQKEFEAVKKDVINNLTPYMKSLISSHKNAMSTYEDYLDTAMLKDGLLKAVAQVIIIEGGGVTMPKNKLALKSISASGKLERAISSKDLALIDAALPEAEKAINAFQADLLRFLREFTGSAQTTVVVLGVSSAVCFAVVGALATPVLIAGGMSAGGAAVTSGAGVGILQSASQELGKHASGNKVTAWDSIQAVVIDGTIGGLTGGIGSKIPLGWCDDAAKAVAPRLASKVPFMATKQLEKFISNYLAGSGQEVIKSAINETVKMLGESVKKGKAPTQKDFDKAVQNILYSALLGGLVKNLGSFQKKWAYKNKDILQGKILPARWDKATKGMEIPNTLKAKMWADVMNKVSDKSLQAGFDAVIAKSSGSENEAKLGKIAEEALKKDKAIQKLVDAEIEKALKKYKVPAV
ncbi:hypothetical protein [Sulfitobacter geojensis]|uniref:hypothetical protein n=1 Tax=Sulfitobacter geojensis TaxID=1342299 RepID=UPI003B8D0400